MEANADDFPEANIEHVMNELNDACLKMADKLDIRDLFESKDNNKTGFVAVSDAREIFQQYLPLISKHAVFTLTRAFERDHDNYEYTFLLQNLNL